jgi:DNA-binding NtrC family response regulator
MKMKQIRILLVDSNPILLKTNKDIPEIEGPYQVDTCPSVLEAKQKIAKEEYYLILCEWHIHSTESLEFLKSIRESDNHISFIVCTTEEDKDIASQAIKLGANGFVRMFGKPETAFSELKRIIEKAINHP